jgi:putative transposase
MSIIRVAIHAVWGTKKRYPFLTDNIRYNVCNHILENAKVKNIYIDTINGYTDHLHCLLYLNSMIPLSKTLQLIKGESAKWLNDNYFQSRSFGWADDYYAASVSGSDIERVREYIRKQKEHHQKITFNDEYEKFINSLKESDSKFEG